MTAVLGDFLRPAREHIALAVSFRDGLPDGATSGAIRELSRMISTLARYVSDLVPPASTDKAPPQDPRLQAAVRVRLALRRSALHLRPAAEDAGDSRESAHPAVQHLAAATDHLVICRDLLQTHLKAGSSSPMAGQTYWTAVASSPPVTAALLSEIAEHARQLAPWAAQLSLAGTGPGPPAEIRLGLYDATRSLYIAAATADALEHQHPLPAEARRLLHGIPVNVISPRRPPGPGELVADLYAGIVETADRIRHLAAGFAPYARWSPAATSLSWQRHALAAAITTHSSEIILRTLFARADQIDAEPQLRAHLDAAAAAAAETWPRWRTIAHHWDTITTGTRKATDLTPVAAEVSDLVLRTGRLAYASPAWTPAAADAAPARDPAELAPGPGDITTAIAAIHHAADALALTARADRQAVQAAANDARLYIPTRLRSERVNIPYRYAHSPISRTAALLTAYDTTADASSLLTMALDDLAVLIDAPSHALAVARRNPPPARQPQAVETLPSPDQSQTATRTSEAGKLTQLVRDLGLTEPAIISRAELADATAADIIEEATLKASRRKDPYGPSSRSRHPAR